MSIKCIRNQITVFGNFSFPADSDTTVMLLTAFGKDGFMPQTVQAMDPSNGMLVQRITLSTLANGGEVRSMLFAHDRIDISFVLPPTTDLEPYISQSVEYLSRVLERAPTYSRLGLVRDFAVGKFGDETERKLAKQLVPLAGDDMFEWSSRWIISKTIDTERYNYMIEGLRQPGLGMVAAGRVESIDGVKLTHDVSTTPENATKRFSVKNLELQLTAMAKLIGDDPLGFMTEWNHG